MTRLRTFNRAVRITRIMPDGSKVLVGTICTTCGKPWGHGEACRNCTNVDGTARDAD